MVECYWNQGLGSCWEQNHDWFKRKIRRIKKRSGVRNKDDGKRKPWSRKLRERNRIDIEKEKIV